MGHEEKEEPFRACENVQGKEDVTIKKKPGELDSFTPYTLRGQSVSWSPGASEIWTEKQCVRRRGKTTKKDRVEGAKLMAVAMEHDAQPPLRSSKTLLAAAPAPSSLQPLSPPAPVCLLPFQRPLK